MSRVITFSRTYPSYHPNAGEQTYFVEKIWKSFYKDGLPESFHPFIDNTVDILTKRHFFDYANWLQELGPKYHTIRAGHRWKVGDWFSPRVWMLPGGRFTKGNKQIQFAPDIQIKKVWDFEMDLLGICTIAKPGEQQTYTFMYSEDMDEEIASNDGLTPEDFYWWFSRSPDFKKKGGFQGQIISWNENIEY